ncbi:glycoside hydrolase family 6 protein [Blastococcus montanus]|uniref:glycoside hydrolase family 6 protein n=1 Tax=Blastococcus montanus TaxID=3144973 RepID=UPI0032088083
MASVLVAMIAPALAACAPVDPAPPAAVPAEDVVAREAPAAAPLDAAQLEAAPPPPVAVTDAPVPAPEAPVAAPAAVESPGPMALAGTVAAADRAGPLTGDTLYGPNSGAAEAAARLRTSSPTDAALLGRMADVPTATWLGSWNRDVRTDVRTRVAEAHAAGGVPVFVAYNVPNLDCGGHSASGGAGSVAGYEAWIREVAAGIGTAEAVVVVEPDTLALLCGNADERTRMLRSAVGVLEANPATHTYLDAGHSNWVDARAMAQRLQAAGVAEADGFALNVSNFETTADNVRYGSELSALLGGARFVVDTGRNGNGPGNDWCNPSGRALGEPTTTQTGHGLVDAFIWIKTPGESDGACNGGPAAGQFWTDYALGLARG